MLSGGGGLGLLRGCSQPRKLTFYCIFGPLFSDCAVVVNPKFSRKKSIFWTKNQVFGQKFEFFSKIMSSLQPRGRKLIKTVTLTRIFAKNVIFVQKCHFLGKKRQFSTKFPAPSAPKMRGCSQFFRRFCGIRPPLRPAPPPDSISGSTDFVQLQAQYIHFD